MDKDKEIELKKLEIEKAKVELEKVKIKEGFIRTLAIILLTIGAGIGASLKILNVPKIWYLGITFILGIAFIGIGVIFIFEVISFKRKVKEIEKWKQQ